MSMNQVVLSDNAPWPRRQEETPAFFQVGGIGPVRESSDPFEKHDEQLIGRLETKITESRGQIVKFEKDIAELKDRIKLFENLREQEFEKVAKFTVALDRQRALAPVPQRVNLSAREQLFEALRQLYGDSSLSGKDAIFSISPSLLDACASDRTVVGNTTTGPQTATYVRGVFGRTAFGTDFTVADVVQKSREVIGKKFNVARNELGLV